MTSISSSSFEIKNAKSKQQIAEEYGICIKTLSKWLKEENIDIRRGLITPKKQRMIYEKFGIPDHSKMLP